MDKAVTPTAQDAELARESSRRLSPYRRRKLRVELPGNGSPGESVEVPAVAVELLVRILTEMADGNPVTLIPLHAELSTQQAADLLNVSRSFVVKLLEERRIPFRKVGSHRRILFSDLLAYKRQSDAKRDRLLADLVADAQEQGGY